MIRGRRLRPPFSRRTAVALGAGGMGLVALPAQGATEPMALSWMTVAALIVLATTAVVGAFLALHASRLASILRGLRESPKKDAHGDEKSASGPDDGPGIEAAPSLNGMIAKLDSAERLNARQFRLQRSQFELFKRMRGDQDPETLAASVLEFVGEYHDAPVGAFYLAGPDQQLVLAASYGVADGEEPPQNLGVGWGVIGRAALKRRILVLDELADTHLHLATGLGLSTPRALIIAPFHFAGQVKGVLELGVARSVQEEDLDFLKLSTESVAMALDSARSRARVHRLLEETRRQATTLAEQQQKLQATNAELERADLCKNEFLANMSHELRTPLNSMLIMSQVLAENRPGHLSRDEVEAALTINKAGNELLMIINDILDMSKVEAGMLELHPEPTDVRYVLRGLEDLFRPVALRQGLELKVVVGADVPATIVMDQLRVSQILKNLLNNAFKFTPSGSVFLDVRPAAEEEVVDLSGAASDWVSVNVRDTGIGMDDAATARIFGAFQQGDSSMDRRYGGSGLGLAISGSLTRVLGGHLRVRSRPGKGSTFTLLLPRQPRLQEAAKAVRGCVVPAAMVPDVPRVSAADDAPATTTTPAPSYRKLLAGRRVLLAGMDMRTVYELSHYLDAMEADVTIVRAAADCRVALKRQGEFDLLLIDGDMLGADGGVAEADIVASALPVLMVGTPPGTDTIPSGRLALDKPVRLEQLARSCKDLESCEPATVSVEPVGTGMAT